MPSEQINPESTHKELARKVLGITTEQEAVSRIAPAFSKFFGIQPEFSIHSKKALKEAQNAKTELLLVLLANGATTLDDGRGMLFGLLRGQPYEETGIGDNMLQAFTKTLSEQATQEVCTALTALSEHKKIQAMFAPQASTGYDTDDPIKEALEERGWQVQSTHYHYSSITDTNNPFLPPYGTGTAWFETKYAVAALPMKKPTYEESPNIKVTMKRSGLPESPKIVLEEIQLTLMRGTLRR